MNKLTKYVQLAGFGITIIINQVIVDLVDIEMDNEFIRFHRNVVAAVVYRSSTTVQIGMFNDIIYKSFLIY